MIFDTFQLNKHNFASSVNIGANKEVIHKYDGEHTGNNPKQILGKQTYLEKSPSGL